MKMFKTVTALACAALMGACSGVETTRNVPFESATASMGLQSTRSASWRVQQVNVRVPDTLTVSEANLFVPNADIVWREDRFGDRREQVRSIIELGVSQAVLGMDGVEPVIVEVELVTFHALTQKARATIGGVHNVKFTVTIRDAETGLQLVDPFTVDASLKAYGGQRAIDAEMHGETQRVRISRHITEVVKQYFEQT